MTLLDTRIDARAVPQPRPRLGRGGHVYSNSPKVKAWKELVKAYAVKFRKNAKPTDKICGVELVFGFERVTKADCDNLAKGIVDALQGILWVNDAQVWKWILDKRQSQHGDYVDIKAWELT